MVGFPQKSGFWSCPLQHCWREMEKRAFLPSVRNHNKFYHLMGQYLGEGRSLAKHYWWFFSCDRAECGNGLSYIWILFSLPDFASKVVSALINLQVGFCSLLWLPRLLWWLVLGAEELHRLNLTSLMDSPTLNLHCCPLLSLPTPQKHDQEWYFFWSGSKIS